MTLQTKAQQAVSTFFDNILSPETRRAYKQDLLSFTEYTAGIPLNAIGPHHVIGYRDALIKAYSTATVIRRLAAVRSLFKHLLSYGIIGVDPTAGVKLPRKPSNCTTEAFTDDEIRRIIQACTAEERPIVELLAYLGLRRSELCSIDRRSFGTDRGIPTITIHGKGGKSRTLPIPKPMRNTLARVVYGIDGRILLGGKPITADRIRHLVDRLAKNTGIDRKVSPHSFRATAVSNALDRGSSPVQVQYMCGWSDMSQISRYDKRRHEIHKSAVWNINYGGSK